MSWRRSAGGVFLPEVDGESRLLCSALRATQLIGFGARVRAGWDTWSPTFKSASMTLSEGNMRAEGTGARTTTATIIGIATGKRYAEMEVVSATGTAARWRIGFVTSGHDPDTGVGAPSSSWALRGDGNKISGGSNTSYAASFATGDIIGLAIDADDDKVWIAVNGTYGGSADPGAGTGEMYSSVSGTIHLAMGTAQSPTTWDVRLRSDPSTFSHSPPSGFTAGWPAA